MMRETDFDGPEDQDTSDLDTLDTGEALDALNPDDGSGEEGNPDDSYVPRRFSTGSEGIVQPTGPARSAETPKRGRGRPRKLVQAGPATGEGKRRGRPPGPQGQAVEMGVSSRHFPKPVAFHFKDDNVGEPRKAAAFFQYMERCAKDPELQSRMMIYVYRNWPVMMRDCNQQDKTSEPFTMDELQSRYGVGDYHIKLNDVGMRKNIAMCTVKGFRSEEFPSIIDYTKVDLTDPLNQSWIERAKSRGIKFPGAAEAETEENTMAEVRVMQQMGNTVDKLTDRIITMSEKQKDNQPPVSANIDHEAMQRGLGIVAEAATMGNTMLQRAIDKVTDQTSKQVDPMEMLSKTMAMTREIMETANARPAQQMSSDQQANNVIADMMRSQLEMQRGFHDKLFEIQQSQITELKAKLESNSHNTQIMGMDHAPKSLMQQIGEMKEIKESMRDVLGIADEAESKPPWIQENLPLIIQGLSVLGAVIANGLHNFAVIKTGQGTPIQPPGPDAVLTEDQKEEMRARGIPVAGPPQAQFTGQPEQSRPTMEGSDMLTQYHQFLAMIKIPLLKSFQEGESGDEFAEKLMLLGDNGHFGENMQGRQVYDMVTSNGKATIMSLIKTYPPIWGIVKTTPDKWEKFMTDFFDAERLLKDKWEEEERGDSEPVTS
jgi:hypothetical protein